MCLVSTATEMIEKRIKTKNKDNKSGVTEEKIIF